MERAIFLDNFSGTQKQIENADRIYLGAQYCPRLLPSTTELEASFDRLGDLPVSLLLPFIPQSFHQAALDLIDLCLKAKPGSEIVAQNWGLVESISRKGGQPVIGRLLIKQPKDPRLLKLLETDSENRFEQLRITQINSEAIKLIKSLNASRIEIDLPPWGLNLPEAIIESNLHVSVHLPYAVVSTTRYCKLAQIHSSRQLLQITDCQRQCKTLQYKLDHPDIPGDMVLYGNTFLHKSAREPDMQQWPTVVDRQVIDNSVPET
jgi:hypothetical protein